MAADDGGNMGVTKHRTGHTVRTGPKYSDSYTE